MRPRRLLLPAILLAALAPPVPRVQARGGAAAAAPAHVVLVVLGGGVRREDMRDGKRMPVLAAMAARGWAVEDVASGAPNAYAAEGRLLTGRREVLDAARGARPVWPTVAEQARAALDLPAEKVWFVSYEGGPRLHLAHSTDPHLGAARAPSVAWGQGAFAQPLAGFLQAFGRPLPVEPQAWKLLEGLRGLSRKAVSTWLPPGVGAGRPSAERVERALLRELDRKALLLPAADPRDAQALRAARTVLEVHHPVLTVILLGEAERAEASYRDYLAALAADDAALGRLRDAVEADASLAGRTTFVVVADRGRDAKPDAKGRLPAGDDSRQRGFVAAVLDGPGLARRRGRAPPRTLEDVAPTVARLLGFDMPEAQGHPWADLLGSR
jgi:hypothetical protein